MVMDMDMSTIDEQSVRDTRGKVEGQMDRGESPMTVGESDADRMTAMEAIQLIVYLLTMNDVKAVSWATQAASGRTARADSECKRLRKLGENVRTLERHNQAFEIDVQQKLMQVLKEVLKKNTSGHQDRSGNLQQHLLADLGQDQLTNIIEYIMDNVQDCFNNSDIAYRVQCLRGQYDTIKSEIVAYVWQQAILLACHQDNVSCEQKEPEMGREESDVLQILSRVSSDKPLLDQLLFREEYKLHSSVLTGLYLAIDACASARSEKKASWPEAGKNQNALSIIQCVDFPITSKSKKTSIVTRVIADKIRLLVKTFRLSSGYEQALQKLPTGEEMHKLLHARNEAVSKAKSILIELLDDMQKTEVTVAFILANSLRCLLIPSYSQPSEALPKISAEKLQLMCRQMLSTSVGLLLPTPSEVKNIAIDTVRPQENPCTFMCTWWIHLQALIDELYWYQGELQLYNNSALTTITKMLWCIPLNDQDDLRAWYTVNLFLEKSLQGTPQIQDVRAQQYSADRGAQTILDSPRLQPAATAGRMQREANINTTMVHRMPAFIIPPNSSLAYLRCDAKVIISMKQPGNTAPVPINTQAHPGAHTAPEYSSIGLEMNFSPISAVLAINSQPPQRSASHQVPVKWDDATIDGRLPVKTEQATTTQTAPLGDSFQWVKAGVRRVLKRQREMEELTAETLRLEEMTKRKFAAHSTASSQADNTHPG